MKKYIVLILTAILVFVDSNDGKYALFITYYVGYKKN